MDLVLFFSSDSWPIESPAGEGEHEAEAVARRAAGLSIRMRAACRELGSRLQAALAPPQCLWRVEQG